MCDLSQSTSLTLGFYGSIKNVSFCETQSNEDVLLELPGA